MDDEERDLTRRSFRGLLTAHPPDELPQRLIDAGWTELLEQDPAAAVSLLADEQGRTLVAGPALNFALMHGLGIPADGTTAVVLPDLTGPSRLPGSDAGGRLEISGIVLGGAGASRFVVATDKAIFEVAAGSIQLRPAQGLDPSLGLQRVAGTVPVDGRELAPVSAWHDATAVGRRALGAELVGIGQAMLEASVDYVGSRRQFGHPIGTFQAVKHRLADVHRPCGARRSLAGR
jgi:alkylation response protein AidB-like acyl-CoA dehydrogenase